MNRNFLLFFALCAALSLPLAARLPSQGAPAAQGAFPAAAPQQLQERGVRLAGLAPVKLLAKPRKVDLLALAPDDKGEVVVITLLQNVIARNAVAAGADSMAVLLLNGARLKEIGDFEKSHPEHTYSVVLRGAGDDKTFPLEASCASRLFM